MINLARLLPATVPAISCRERRGAGAVTRSYYIEEAPVVTVVLRSSRADMVSLDLSSLGENVRVAQFVLRHIAAELAVAGVAEISIAPPANPFAARALVDSGFGRGTGRLARKLITPEPLMQRRHDYGALRGLNLIAVHIALAEPIVQRFASLSGVELILGLGSLGRGFADKYSDIDLFIVGSGKSLRHIPAGETWVAGYDFDIFVVDRDVQPYASWANSRRQAVAEGVILYRRTERIVRALRRLIKLSRRDLRVRTAERLLQLAWIGFQPSQLAGETRYGYSWCGERDTWLRRGDAASAHASVDQAAVLLVELLFLINGFEPPDAKWRRFLVRTLPWLPSQFDTRLTRIEEGRRESSAFGRRANHLQTLIDDSFDKLCSDRLIAKNVYTTYLRSTHVYTHRQARRRNAYS